MKITGTFRSLLFGLLVLTPGVEAQAADSEVDSAIAKKSLRSVERSFEKYMPVGWNPIDIELGRWTEEFLDPEGEGSAEDGSPIQLLTFRGKKGETYSVSVRSGDFDPLIWLVERQSRVMLKADDDSGDGPDAELSTVLPRTGAYLIAVNSYGEGGNYQLRVDRQTPFRIPDNPVNSKRRAVLIGVNDYLGAENDLLAPLHDLEEVRELLETDAGFQSDDILEVRDSHATLENVRKAIHEFLAPVPPEGTAVIFYSGHGVQLKETSENRSSATGAAPEPDLLEEALFLADGSYLLDHELRGLIDCIGAGRVTLIVDACYSGGIVRGPREKRVLEEDIREFLDLASRDRPMGEPCAIKSRLPERHVDMVLSASQEDEVAWEWSKWPGHSTPRSVFTYFLLDELRHALRGPSPVLVQSVDTRVSRRATTFTKDKLNAFQKMRVVNLVGDDPYVHELFGLPGPRGLPGSQHLSR